MEGRGLCWSCIHQKDCKYHKKDINKVVAECHKYIPDNNNIFYQMIADHFDEVADMIKDDKKLFGV